MTVDKPLRAFVDRRGLRYQWVAQQLEISPSHLTRVLDGAREISPGLALRFIDLFGDDVREALPEYVKNVQKEDTNG